MSAPALPEPLTPESCDLRGLNYMPLMGNHLFGSDFNAAATDAEWRAGITLYWAAWNQVPAGSLPNDDKALCRLADLGRDVAAWQALRAGALHGFVECSDGRLYHPFLCEQARVAWSTRVAARDRKAQWRAKKSTAGRVGNGPVPETETGTGRGHDGPVPAEKKQRDVAALKGSNVAVLRTAPKRQLTGTTGQGAEPPVPPSPGLAGDAVKANPKTKQPLGGKKPGAMDWLSDAAARDSAGVKLGLGTMAQATAKGMKTCDYRVALFNAAHAAGLVGQLQAEVRGAQ